MEIEIYPEPRRRRKGQRRFTFRMTCSPHERSNYRYFENATDQLEYLFLGDGTPRAMRVHVLRNRRQNPTAITIRHILEGNPRGSAGRAQR